VTIICSEECYIIAYITDINKANPFLYTTVWPYRCLSTASPKGCHGRGRISMW